MSAREELRCLVVEDRGQWDWSLSVLRRGPGEKPEVLATKAIPHDGTLTFSTEDRATSPAARSEYRLDVDAVVERYAQHSGTETSRVALREDVEAALTELQPAVATAGGEQSR